MFFVVISSCGGSTEAEQDQESSQVKQEEKEEDKEDDEQQLESEGWAVFKADGVEFQLNLKEKLEKDRKDQSTKQDAEKEDDEDVERYFIGESKISYTCFLSENRLMCKKKKKEGFVIAVGVQLSWLNTFNILPLESASRFIYNNLLNTKC